MTDECAVYAFADYEAPARRLAERLSVPCRAVDVHRFPDGESRITLPAPVAKRVILCRTLDHPNEKLVELLLASRTATELGAEQLMLVAPYLCYMRQDKAFTTGEAVSQRIIGRMLDDLFDVVITVDPHLHRTQHLAEIIPGTRCITMSASTLMSEHIANHLEAPFIVGPDAESEQWVRRIADPCGFDAVVGSKQRRGDRSVRFSIPEVDLQRRDVVVVDDIASTGFTLAAAVAEVRKHAPASVTVFVVHPLFVGDAFRRIVAGGVAQVWSSDSIVHPTNAVELADLIAVGIDSAE